MPTGQMIAGDVPPPVQPTPPAMGGSPIQAAAGVLQDKTDVLAGAVKNLGGGSRRRRSRGRSRGRRRRFVGGGDVPVPRVPNMPSAGGVDPKATYGGLLQLQHAAVAAGAYDGLGNATPMNMNSAVSGGRRKRSRRRNNGRRKRSAQLGSRRTRRRTRHVRSSRR